MSHHTVQAILAATAAFALALTLAIASSASASADGQIVVTRPDGSLPGALPSGRGSSSCSSKSLVPPAAKQT